MGDKPYWNMSVPLGGSGVTLGAGAAVGVTITAAAGAVFSYSAGKTDINADGAAWIQSTSDAGICAASGVKIGSPAGVLATAGGNVDIWAGAALAPSVPGPAGPGKAPAAPSPPCGDTKGNVDKINALNSGIKATSDVIDAFTGDAGKFEKTYNALKGGWDYTKAMNDVADEGDKFIPDSVGKMVDGVFGVADGLAGIANGDVPNPVGLVQAGKKILDAGEELAEGDAGAGGSDGSGGGAGGGAGGHGGGGKVVAKAPAGIEKITDANMEAWAGGKIEYKAGSNIVMNAGSKVETCSMVFEAHANVSATVKGLARATLESAGKTTVNGGALVDIKSGALVNVVAPALRATVGRTQFKGASFKVIAADVGILGTVKINGATRIEAGKLSVINDGFFSGDLDVDGCVGIKSQLEVKAGAKIHQALFVKNGATIKNLVKLG